MTQPCEREGDIASLMADRTNMSNDIGEIKKDIKDILVLLKGNGNDGMKIRLDRLEQKAKARLWSERLTKSAIRITGISLIAWILRDPLTRFVNAILEACL